MIQTAKSILEMAHRTYWACKPENTWYYTCNQEQTGNEAHNPEHTEYDTSDWV